MMPFPLSTARSFVGKPVNLHLVDGSTIVNVSIKEVAWPHVNEHSKINYVYVKVQLSSGATQNILLRDIHYAQLIYPAEALEV